MGLVERVRHDVEQRQRPQAEAALQQHEAHLRHGRPGKCGLDGTLRQHHGSAEQGRQSADHHQRRHRARIGLHQRRQADEQHAARIDDARMQQGRHRCRRLHHLGEPAMEREGRRLQHGREHQKRHAEPRRQRHALRRRRSDGRHRAAAEACGEKHRGEDQRHIARAPHQGEFRRGAPRLGPLRIEQQQLAQHHADGDETEDQHGKAAGLHKDQHRRQRREHQPVEAALARLAIEIGAGIAHHDPADEAHQQRHADADRIEPQRQHEGPAADAGGRRITQEQGRNSGDCAGQRHESRGLGENGQRRRPPSRPAQRERGGGKQQQRCKHGEQGRCGHGSSP